MAVDDCNVFLHVIKRKTAKSIGLVRYYSGKPCPKGHFSERFVSFGQCVTCTISSRNSWYNNNKERASIKNKLWMQNNPEKKKAKNTKWRKANPEKAKNAVEQHRVNNPEKYTSYRANRRARFRGAKGNGITSQQIKDLIAKQSNICIYCKKKGNLTLDHIIPLARGGLHDITNAQMICKSCNSSKCAKDPYEYASSIGMLL
jgi:5-methylcytosine-specific restriction endonuclease McrA